MVDKDQQYGVTYIIGNSTIVQLKVPPDPSRPCEDLKANANQPAVTQRLARLKRYHKQNVEARDTQVQDSSLKKSMQAAVYSHHPECFYVQSHIAIITPYNIELYQLAEPKSPNIDRKPLSLKMKNGKNGLLIKSPDLITLYDFKAQNSKVDVVYITKNPSGIISMHLNSNQRKIDFNQSIYGITFLHNDKILIRLERQFFIYTLELELQRQSQILFPVPIKNSFLSFAPLPTILRVQQDRIFFVYTAVVYTPESAIKAQYMTMLEEFKMIKDGDTIEGIEGIQRIVVQSSIDPQTIKNMVIISESTLLDQNSNLLKIYLLLNNNIVFIKEKTVSNGDYPDQSQRFFTVECTIKPKQYANNQKSSYVQRTQEFRTSQNSRDAQTSRAILDNKEADRHLSDLRSNVFLLKVNKNITVLNCEYNNNTRSEPSTICLHSIVYSDNHSVCNIEYKLNDIIFVDHFEPSNDKIIYSFYYLHFILLVLYDPVKSRPITIVCCETSTFDQKLKSLMPSKLGSSKQQSTISQKRMSLLLKFNSIFSRVQNSREYFFKQLWQKVKEMAIDEKNGAERGNKSSEAQSQVMTLEGIIGRNNIQYLFMTENLDYISKQIKDLIDKNGKISLELLKTYHHNMKKISAFQLQAAGNDLSAVPLAEYLKSGFYLKKIQERDQSKEISVADYKRWKKKKVTDYFYQSWQEGHSTKVLSFLGRFFSFFINSYEDIMRELIENHLNFGKTKLNLNWRTAFTNLLKLLPKYPDERKLADLSNNDKSRDNHEQSFDIDNRIAFQNINNAHEETTYQDIQAEFGNLTDEQINNSRFLQDKYMRNNDFLFIHRPQLQRKMHKLTAQKHAIYLFLQFMRDKLKCFFQKEWTRQVPDNEYRFLSLTYVLEQLKDNRHISMKKFYRIKIDVEIYNYAEKQGFENLPPLGQYLERSQSSKFNLLFFDQQNITEARNIRALREIKSIWSLNWMNICGPGQKYFKKVLDNNELDARSVNVDLFNSSEEVTGLIFQSAMKRYFIQDDNHFEGDKIDRFMVIFSRIGAMQEKDQEQYGLLVEFLVDSIFQTMILNQNNEEGLKKILETIMECHLELEANQQKIQIQEYTLGKHETLAQKINLFLFVKLNFHIFKDFQLNVTINSMKMEPGQDIEVWIQEISKIQVHLMRNPRTQSVCLYRLQPGKQQSVFKTDTLQNIFELQKKLVLHFISDHDEEDQAYCESLLLHKFYKVALEIGFKGTPLGFDLEALVEMQLGIDKKRLYDDYDLASDSLLQEVIKEFILRAKKERNYEFILKCLKMLQKLKKNDKDQYIKVESLLVVLKKREFQPALIKDIKSTYGILVISSTDPVRTKELEETYMIQMSQYIDNKIRDIFSKGIPSFCALRVLLTNFPNSYFFNHQSEDNKAYDSHYLVIKLLNAILQEPPNIVHKSESQIVASNGRQSRLCRGNELQKEQQHSLNKQPPEKQLKTKRIYKFISDFIGTVDQNNFIETLESKWRELTGHEPFAKDFPNQDSDSDNLQKNTLLPIKNNNIELSQSDIRIYTYFPEYTKKIEYYMLGKMLEVQGKFSNAMTFLVRYWDQLKYELESVVLLIRASLSNPLKSQATQQQDINQVCLMFVNRLKDNKYLSIKYTFEQLERILKKEKKVGDANSKKTLEYLQQFIGRLRNLKSQSKRPVVFQEDNQQHTTGNNGLTHRRANQSSFNVMTRSNIVDRQVEHRNSTANNLKDLQTLFNPEQIHLFIKAVQERMASGEKHNTNDKIDLERFRIFVGCIKFDKQLVNLFSYKFLNTATKKMKPQEIFNEFIRDNVEKEITGDNYLRIGKALRYGFNNDIKMEINVTKLYLKQIAMDYEVGRKEEKREFEKKVRSVLDMIDTKDLDQNSNDIEAVLKGQNVSAKNGAIKQFLDKYMFARKEQKYC